MRQLTLWFAAVLCIDSVFANAANYTSYCPSAASESWLDMSSWLQAGLKGRWEVQDAGRTVKQYVNTPGPGFYMSEDQDIIDVVITGTVSVRPQVNSDGSPVKADDDFLGMAVGFHGPTPSDQWTYDGLLFSWGGKGASGPNPVHSQYTLQKLNGSHAVQDFTHSGGTIGDCFWYRTSNGNNAQTNRENVGCLLIDQVDSDGWEEKIEYPFQILFSEERITIAVAGVELFNFEQWQLVVKCEANTQTNVNDAKCYSPVTPVPPATNTKKGWRKGRIAWYNLSQHGVIYGNVRLFKLQPGQTAPVTAEDFYGVERNSPGRDQFLKMTVAAFEGALANDWSPLLKNMNIQVAPTFGQDPQTQSTGTTHICKEGSTLVIQADGSFEFTPEAQLITRSNSGEINVEECEYIVSDTSTPPLWSSRQNITFALEPASLACPVDGCFDLNWEPEDHEHDWYRAIPKEASFGELFANGSCVRIKQWQLTDGGAEGRFKFKGSHIVANHPDRIEMKYLERTIYKMSVLAIDIFGNVASMYVSIIIPAECELDNNCVCSNALSCACFDGFTGARCELCEPQLKDISVNPNCTECAECPLTQANFPGAAAASGVCLFPEKVCNVFCTRDLNCSTHGDCLPDIRVGECNCDANFTGAACDDCAADHFKYPDCIYCKAEDTCNGNGVCNMDGTCKCDPHFDGPRCDQCMAPFYKYPACDLSCDRAGNCSGNGECIEDWVLAIPHYCQCDPQWRGSYTTTGCNESCSRDSYCSGHGECNNFECDCDEMSKGGSGTFSGIKCGQCATTFYPDGVCNLICSPSFCNHHGTCGDMGCECYQNLQDGYFTGTTCDKCSPQYFPEGFCNQYCDDDATCNARGNCNDQGYCVCTTPGFGGDNCTECAVNYYSSQPNPPSCDLFCERSANCSSHGECNLDSTLPVCDCQPNWYNDDCSIECTDELCSNRGTCSPTGICQCNAGFTGKHCAECEPNLYPPGTGTDACTIYCEPTTTCSDNGKCAWGTGLCDCNTNWIGDNCSISTTCDQAKDCNNRGTCREDGGCDCKQNHVGSNCSECLPNWFPPGVHSVSCTVYCEAALNCSSNGICDWNTGGCFCNPGYEPPDCLRETQGATDPTSNSGGNDCLLFEIGGMCLGWLVLLLILLILCCLALALYLLLKKKKAPPPKKSPSGEWGGGDLTDMEAHKINEGKSGVNFGGSANGGNGNTFGPGSKDGMEPLLKEQATPDQEPLLGGAPPAALGGGGGSFGPGDMEGMNPLLGGGVAAAGVGAAAAASGAPEAKDKTNAKNDFFPGDLGGMEALTPAAAPEQRWNADALTPEQQAALEEGKPAAAIKEVMAKPDTPAGNASDMQAAARAVDQANGDLHNAAIEALNDPTLEPAARTELEKALDNAWGPAELDGMDPLAKQALSDGKKAALIGGALAAGGIGGATAAKLSGAMDKWGAANDKARAAASDGAASKDIPSGDRALLSSVATKGAAETENFAKLAGPTHLAAAAYGKVPEAVRSVNANPSVPDTATTNTKSSLRNLDKKTRALEKAMRDATSSSSTPPSIQDSFGRALNGNWEGADTDGMEPLKGAVKEGGLAEVTRTALRRPGLPKKSRKKLEEALRGCDAARESVITAATEASDNPSVPAAQRQELKDALGQQRTLADKISSNGDPMIKEAAARGRVIEAAEAALPFANHTTQQDISSALSAAKSGNADLLSAVSGIQDGNTKQYLEDIAKGDLNTWGPADLSDMAPLAAAGALPIAVRQALRHGELNAGDRKALESALAKSDAAAAALASTGRDATKRNELPDAVQKNLSNAVSFGQQPGVSLMSQMDPLQRAATARGHVPVAAVAAVENMPEGSAKVNLQQSLEAQKNAEERLRQQAKNALENPGLPQRARQVLEDALNDNTWGPASDLAGMDPVLRAAMAGGQTAATVRAILAQPDLPKDLRSNLEAALQDANNAHGDLTEASKNALKELNGADNGLAKALQADANPWAGFDGKVDLSGMDPLSRAAAEGMVPAAVRNVLSTHKTAPALQKAAESFQSQEAAFKKAVQNAISSGTLPPAAAQQLRDALDGKVSFVYGNVDMQGMDPTQGVLAAAVQSVVSAGGLGAGQAQLESALSAMNEEGRALSSAVHSAVNDSSTPQAAKEELQDALYGKARLANYGFTAADIDLTSDEFAPIGHAAAGGLPGLSPEFTQGLYNNGLLGGGSVAPPSAVDLGGGGGGGASAPRDDKFGHAGLGDNTMANMNPVLGEGGLSGGGGGGGLGLGLGGTTSSGLGTPASPLGFGSPTSVCEMGVVGGGGGGGGGLFF